MKLKTNGKILSRVSFTVRIEGKLGIMNDQITSVQILGPQIVNVYRLRVNVSDFKRRQGLTSAQGQLAKI